MFRVAKKARILQTGGTGMTFRDETTSLLGVTSECAFATNSAYVWKDTTCIVLFIFITRKPIIVIDVLHPLMVDYYLLYKQDPNKEGVQQMGPICLTVNRLFFKNPPRFFALLLHLAVVCRLPFFSSRCRHSHHHL